MRVETPDVVIHFRGPVTLRVDRERLEFVFAPQATTVPEEIPEVLEATPEVEIIFQCGNSEFVIH